MVELGRKREDMNLEKYPSVMQRLNEVGGTEIQSARRQDRELESFFQDFITEQIQVLARDLDLLDGNRPLSTLNEGRLEHLMNNSEATTQEQADAILLQTQDHLNDKQAKYIEGALHRVEETWQLNFEEFKKRSRPNTD